MIEDSILSIYMWFDQFWFREANTRIWKHRFVESGGMGLSRHDERKIRFRPMRIIMVGVVLISMMWEATLAIPYGWWGYKNEQMMGILIKPWSDLPIEAALLWLVVTFTTAIIYETIIGWLCSGESFWKYFFKKGSNETAGSDSV